MGSVVFVELVSAPGVGPTTTTFLPASPPTPIANVGDTVGTTEDDIVTPSVVVLLDVVVRVEIRPFMLGSVVINAGRRARIIRRRGGTTSVVDGGGLLIVALLLSFTVAATLNKSFAGPFDDDDDCSHSFGGHIAYLGSAAMVRRIEICFRCSSSEI